MVGMFEVLVTLADGARQYETEFRCKSENRGENEPKHRRSRKK